MSATPNVIQPEGPAKKPAKQSKEEVKKPVEPKPADNPIPGAGETPKPAKPKKPKERPAKPSSGSIADSVPKKNAQRAKGSISLNKTIEQSSADKITGAKSEAAAKILPEEPTKAAPPPTQKRRKKREGEKKAPTAAKPLRQEPSCESVEVKALEVDEVAEQEKVEAKSEVIRPVATGFNSCSFFEKLQQGVKAYFSSRSSFNQEERDKKEGGVRKSECPSLRPRGKTEPEPVGRRSGLAPANAPIAHLRKEKSPIKEDAKGEAFAPECSDRALPEIEETDFERRVNEYVEMNWPGNKGSEGIPDEFELLHLDGGVQMSVISEDANTNGWSFFGFGEDLLTGLEATNEEMLENFIDPIHLSSEGTWNALFDCMGTALGREQLVYNTEVTQMGAPPNAQVPLERIEEEPPVDVFGIRDGGMIRAAPSAILCDPEEHTLAATLMSGIDLHLELQNYLKDIESSIKGRANTATLECDFSDNYIPLKIYSSSQDVQNGAEVFFDVSENKSSSSFDTASSDCPQLEEAADEMFLDVRLDDPKIPDESDDLRETKSEYDPQKRRNLRNTVKRTDGRISFREFRLGDESTRCCSPQRKSRPGKSLGENSADCYEKIKPFCGKEWTRKSQTSYRSSGYSLSDESVRLNVPKATSDVKPLGQTPVRPVESELPKGRSSRGMVLPTNSPQPEGPAFKWYLSLQELIGVYDSVLIQNKKSQRGGDRMSRNFSSQLSSYLSEKLKEKHSGSDGCESPERMGKDDAVELEEYVAMCREILESSLSINQIVRLNDIVSCLRESSERNCTLLKELAEWGENVLRESTVTETKPEPVESEPERTPDCIRNVSLAKSREIPEKPNKPTTEIKTRTQAEARPKPKQQAKWPAEENKATHPLPAELQSILKMCYASEASDAKNEIFVTVKLCGNQIMVNGFTGSKNKKALSDGKPNQIVMSELIIENLTKGELGKENWWKNAKRTRVRALRPVTVEGKGKKPCKKQIQFVATNAKKQPRPKSANLRGGRPKVVEPKPERKENESEADESSDNRGSKTEGKENQKELAHFEYDHLKLRAQHPMEAIAETSETKLSQHLENPEDVLRERTKSEPPPNTGILFRDIHINQSTMKETVKAVLEKKLFSKELICDFGWSEERIRKTISEFRPQAKRLPTPKKNNQTARVRSMVDLKKKPCGMAQGRKSHPQRPRSTYLCYSSVQHSQGQTSRKKRPDTRSLGTPKTKWRTGDQRAKKVCKITKEAGPKQQVSDCATSKSACPNKEPPAETILERLTEKISIESDLLSDGCGVEFLFSENNTLSIQGSLVLSGRQFLRISPDDSAVQHRNSFGSKESPDKFVVALPAPTKINDASSLVTEMIHSDSFLVDLPLHGKSHSKLKPLFQSDSEIKFYPGRLMENGVEERPLVTFILTPSQNEEAKLPTNQVKVVGKRDTESPTSDGSDDPKGESAQTEHEEVEEKHSLKSIEEFIAYLTKCKKAALCKKNLPNALEKVQRNQGASGCREKSAPKRRQTAQIPTPKRKPLYEPPKRKPARTGDAAKGRSQKVMEKGGTSDSCPQKMVDNLLHALENLKEGNPKWVEKEEDVKVPPEGKCVLPIEDEPKTEEHPESGGKRVKYTLTGMSVSLEDVSPVVLNAIKAAIGRAEGFAHGEEVIAALEEAFSRNRTEQTDDSEADALEGKLKTFKVKIHCNGTNRADESPAEGRRPSGEIDLLDSFVSRETEGSDLRRRNSTYFDAEENFRADGEKTDDGKRTDRPTEEGTLDLNAEFGVAEEENPRSSSDGQLRSVDVAEETSEVIISEEISESLERGEVTRSVELLGGFLKGAETSDRDRLKKLLRLVEKKTRSIMVNMEKMAWLKVLSLLEELSQLLEGEEDIDDSVKAHLKSTKSIVDKIQSLNVRRLTDLKRFCYSLMQSFGEIDNRGSVIDRIKDVLKHLTEKFIRKRSSRRIEDDPREKTTGNTSGIKLHSTVSLPEIREDRVKETNREDPQYLKQKLRHQYFCMQQLVQTEKPEFLPVEIQRVRRKVAEKMKSLEKAFEGDNLGESSRSAADSFARATPLLKLADDFRSEEECSSSGRNPSSEVRLNRSSGYSDLMKCLIKAWDTRLTSSITSECFS